MNYFTLPESPKMCQKLTSLKNNNCEAFTTTSDCQYPINSNLNGCLYCPQFKNYFIQDTSACSSTCPNGYYQNSDICYKCSSDCLTCRDHGNDNCTSCDKNSEKFILQNNTCREKCIADREIYISAHSKCYDLVDMIESVLIEGPDKLNLLTPQIKLLYTVVVSCKYQIDCTKIGQFLVFEWEYDKTLINLLPIGIQAAVSLASVQLNTASVSTIKMTFKYNNLLIGFLNKIITIKEYKLVPNISNEDQLIFNQNSLIVIDASASYDEMILDDQLKSPDDNQLIITWECPDLVKNASLCSSSNVKKMVIEPSVYVNSMSNSIKWKQNEIFFVAVLKKDSRLVKRSIKVIILPSNSQISLSDNARISHKGAIVYGIVEFIIEFLIDMLNPINYLYHWRLNNLDIPNETLVNSNDGLSVKMNTIFMSQENNTVSLDIISKNNTSDITTLYHYFIKPEVPFAGNCTVDPQIGTSMFTSFTFAALGWNSSFPPLLYRFFLKTENNLEINLMKGYSINNILISENIPSGNDFFMEVLDNQGNNNIVRCPADIRANTSLSLSNLTKQLFNPDDKLKIITIYTSNKNLTTNERDFTINTIYNSLHTNSSNNLNFDKINLILNQMNIITKDNFPSFSHNSQFQINQIVNALVNHSSAYIHKDSLVINTYKVLDNLFNEVEFLKSNVSIKNNSTKGNFSEYKEFYEDFHRMVGELNINNFNHLDVGNIMNFPLQNFEISIAKLSPFNAKSFSFDNANNGASSISKGSLIESPECSKSSILCISSQSIGNTLKRINKQVLDKGIGIITQHNKRNTNPLRLVRNQYSFSKDNLNFSLLSYPYQSYLPGHITLNSSLKRNLEVIDVKENNDEFPYTIKLKMDTDCLIEKPDMNNISSFFQIKATFCYQIDTKMKPLNNSCLTWNDYKNDSIICKCKSTGLTLNIWDDSIAQFIKLSQFPYIDFGTLSFWAVFIVSMFGLVLLVNIFVYYVLNMGESNTKTRGSRKDFDYYQHSYIKYMKKKFHKKRDFFTLFKFILQHFHSVTGIFYNYSVNYEGMQRMIDFFLSLYLPIFFSLIPLYYWDDESRNSIMIKSQLSDIDIDINNLPLKLYEFFYQLLYSIFANMISFLLIMFINCIHYENVIMKNFDRHRFYLKKFTDIVIKQEKQDWIRKVKRALVKIKAIKCLAEHFCDPRFSENKKYILNIPNFNQNSKGKNDKKKKKKIEEEVKESDHRLSENQKTLKGSNEYIDRRNNIFDTKHEKLLKDPKNDKKKSKFLFGKTNVAIEFFKKKFLKLDFKSNPFNIFHRKKKKENNSIEMTQTNNDLMTSIYVSTGFQFLSVEHKYSFSFNGSYFVKIDMGEFTYQINECNRRLNTKDHTRRFAFALNLNQVTYHNLSIYAVKIEPSEKVLSIRRRTKYFCSLGLMILIFIYMIGFIEVSYKNYGQRFFSLWIYPILIMFLSDYFINQIFMIVLYTALLYFWGKETYSLSKWDYKSLLFKIIVPSELVSMHKGIIEFQQIYDHYNK